MQININPLYILILIGFCIFSYLHWRDDNADRYEDFIKDHFNYLIIEKCKSSIECGRKILHIFNLDTKGSRSYHVSYGGLFFMKQLPKNDTIYTSNDIYNHINVGDTILKKDNEHFIWIKKANSIEKLEAFPYPNEASWISYMLSSIVYFIFIFSIYLAALVSDHNRKRYN